MAYQLKTSGIATKVTMCIAVDPDTDAIKDFASSTVTADMTVGASVTIGEQAWDGITRKYFRLGSGTAADDMVAFGTNKPQWTFGTAGMKRTVVFICEAAGAAVRAWGASSSNYFAGGNLSTGGSTKPTFVVGVTLTGSGAALASGNKAMFGFLLDRGVSSTAFYAADTDSAMTMVTGLAAVTPSSGTYDFGLAYIGRRNDSSAKQQDKIHAALIFNDLLTEAELDSLRDDWFGTLLESAGGGGGGSTLPLKLQLLTGA